MVTWDMESPQKGKAGKGFADVWGDLEDRRNKCGENSKPQQSFIAFFLPEKKKRTIEQEENFRCQFHLLIFRHEVKRLTYMWTFMSLCMLTPPFSICSSQTQLPPLTSTKATHHPPTSPNPPRQVQVTHLYFTQEVGWNDLVLLLVFKFVTDCESSFFSASMPSCSCFSSTSFLFLPTPLF